MAEVPSVEIAPGYRVPRIITGAWQLSAGHQKHPMSPDEARRACDRLVAHGFTVFDCADIYTGVEEFLGEYMARQSSSVRQRVRVHTKFVPDRDDLADVDRAYVRRIVERSLSRLQVDRLDMVQFAWWDYAVPGYVEAGGWLTELRNEGKIRLLGTTNFDAPRCAELADAGLGFVAHQVQYSPLDDRPGHGLAADCERRDEWLLCYGALAGGLLSARHWGASEQDDANRSHTKYKLVIREFGGQDLYQELLGVLGAIAERHDVSLSSVALAWLLARPRVAAAIVGISRDDHIEENLAACRLRLEAVDLDAIADVLARRRGPAGDVFGLEREPDGDHARIMRYNLNAD